MLDGDLKMTFNLQYGKVLSIAFCSCFLISNDFLPRKGKTIKMPNEDREFIKTRLKDSAFTSFQSFDCNSKINLSKNERLTLNNLRNNKNIIIQKSDEGNSVVLLDKDKYLEGMSKILNNSTMFEILQFDHGAQLYLKTSKKKKKCPERS